MISRRQILFSGAGLAALAACAPAGQAKTPAYLAPSAGAAFADSPFRALTTAQWKARLAPASFDVLRREGTERPGSSPLNHEKRAGVFACAGCALPLFKSEWKFESGTGWPSFWTVIDGAVETKTDTTFAMTRVEYHCARCLGHQGHVFEDGPRPTGLRYCNNGAALTFAASAA